MLAGFDRVNITPPTCVQLVLSPVPVPLPIHHCVPNKAGWKKEFEFFGVHSERRGEKERRIIGEWKMEKKKGASIYDLRTQGGAGPQKADKRNKIS